MLLNCMSAWRYVGIPAVWVGLILEPGPAAFYWRMQNCLKLLGIRTCNKKLFATDFAQYKGKSYPIA